MIKTILIIDDDNLLRASLAKGLRAEDFEVIAAQSAEIAEQILERVEVDAIVLDRMMEGMDGLSFLKKLRKSGNATPVIMLTAMSGPENAIDGLFGGADDYLAKPFQLKELVLRLRNLLRNAPVGMAGLPKGLDFSGGEFYIKDAGLLSLSATEKELLKLLTSPVGNIAPAAPMVAKRLRAKLNNALPDADIITVRGQGYKLINC